MFYKCFIFWTDFVSSFFCPATEISYLSSASLCSVASAGSVTPGSEIWCALAHRASLALSPVETKIMLRALQCSCESTELFDRLPNVSATITPPTQSSSRSVSGQLSFIEGWGQKFQPRRSSSVCVSDRDTPNADTYSVLRTVHSYVLLCCNFLIPVRNERKSAERGSLQEEAPEVWQTGRK